MRCSRPMAPSCMLLLWAFFFLFIGFAWSKDSTDTAVDKQIENGGYIVTRDGAAIAGFNADTAFIPASTIKIATALTALELLGPSYRIKTEFYLRGDTILCIKGFGDPYLISERIDEIALALRKRGLTRLEGIILDDHFFELETPADGSEKSDNPYDADNSALAVNFNSLPLIKHDTGAISSPEPQTPVLNIARDIGSLLAPGLHRVNVSAYTGSNQTITPLRYAAELFAELLRGQNIAVDSSFKRGRIDSRDQLIFTYQSRMTVAEMIRGCLKYSNNFIANQLFLYCGAKRFGPPATWEKGRKALSEVLESRAEIDSKLFTIKEGSGLSRNNRITPTAMIALLQSFKPYVSLLSEKNGTLLKSGTMTGVYGYAGYFRTDQSLDPFVILLNQETNTRQLLLSRLSTLYNQKAE